MSKPIDLSQYPLLPYRDLFPNRFYETDRAYKVYKMSKSLISAAELKKIPELPDNLQTGKFLELDKAYKVYKKACYIKGGHRHHVVITLVLSEGTVIFTGQKGQYPSFHSDKMRANQAIVVRFDLAYPSNISRKEIQSAISFFHNSFEYPLNEMVFPDKFSRAYITCNGGIHFFRTFVKAKSYNG